MAARGIKEKSGAAFPSDLGWRTNLPLPIHDPNQSLNLWTHA
jgi:hypothetical protein